MANVRLIDVCKKYDNGVLAVNNVNLEIRDKEFVVFVGPSGCGKSTTLRMIAGLEDITDGEIYIDNLKANDVPAKDRDIAMVFQNYALYPHMTVEENMGFALKLRKESKKEIKEKVMEAAKLLQLEDLLSRKPKELSGGQRQRVALGRAIVRNPKVFLMDEPLSNLDAKLRTEMRSVIMKLHKRLQATFIYVTHDQVEAMTMGDRIVVMNKGVVQQFDTPQNLYNNPKNLFVATFLGSPQMNTIECQLYKNEKGYFALLKNNDTIMIPFEKGKMLEKRGYVGKEVILGIRPEHITKKENEEINDEIELQGKVILREIMGSETFVHIQLGTQQIISKFTEGMDAKIDDNIEVILNSKKIFFFDKDTQENIFFSDR
ncbi:ABC transporter ATP-binding protein [Anaerobranca gottschalkii]|uniref:Multiple sugar transport system ATP-binding protein n=1 Tax=Anaerobranca gottschalkii DSM 13577 TaxID=1120990 RepID=A0A1H9YNU0_9FIRM|nr:sn-glycerol-3-phosphate ABC transporter ATP-binding protein UgpC [Anaerobranca gottschalkii]SES70733.1 multiple sugar transport system ATP-binding protein [Anaerobranca gottschalkii DSM 13577]